jgi:hypothetical protein
MLIYFSGCVSSRILSKSDLPVSGNYPYKILCQKTNFLLTNVEISNGLLTGKIEMAGSTRTMNIVNIYLTSDSVVKIGEGKILSLPCDSITKVRFVEPSAGKSFFLGLGISVILVVILLNSSFLNFNLLPGGI